MRFLFHKYNMWAKACPSLCILSFLCLLSVVGGVSKNTAEPEKRGRKLNSMTMIKALNFMLLVVYLAEDLASCQPWCGERMEPWKKQSIPRSWGPSSHWCMQKCPTRKEQNHARTILQSLSQSCSSLCVALSDVRSVSQTVHYHYKPYNPVKEMRIFVFILHMGSGGTMICLGEFMAEGEFRFLFIYHLSV